MASIQRVKVNGHSYWRIVDSRRIDGKPRAIPLMHLGTADALLNRLLNSPAGRRLRIRSSQHGHILLLSHVYEGNQVDARLSMALKSSGKKGGRPRCEWQLEHMDDDIHQLYRDLVPPKKPFVYTATST